MTSDETRLDSSLGSGKGHPFPVTAACQTSEQRCGALSKEKTDQVGVDAVGKVGSPQGATTVITGKICSLPRAQYANQEQEPQQLPRLLSVELDR